MMVHFFALTRLNYSYQTLYVPPRGIFISMLKLHNISDDTLFEGRM